MELIILPLLHNGLHQGTEPATTRLVNTMNSDRRMCLEKPQKVTAGLGPLHAIVIPQQLNKPYTHDTEC